MQQLATAGISVCREIVRKRNYTTHRRCIQLQISTLPLPIVTSAYHFSQDALILSVLLRLSQGNAHRRRSAAAAAHHRHCCQFITLDYITHKLPITATDSRLEQACQLSVCRQRVGALLYDERPEGMRHDHGRLAVAHPANRANKVC